MSNYTDQEIEAILIQQKQNFERTARGSGYTAKSARNELERISKLSQEERIANARASLEKMR